METHLWRISDCCQLGHDRSSLYQVRAVKEVTHMHVLTCKPWRQHINQWSYALSHAHSTFIDLFILLLHHMPNLESNLNLILTLIPRPKPEKTLCRSEDQPKKGITLHKCMHPEGLKLKRVPTGIKVQKQPHPHPCESTHTSIHKAQVHPKSFGQLHSRNPLFTTATNHTIILNQSNYSTESSFYSFPRSSKLSYRVFVGKHNLVVDEAASKAILPEKIIVHEKWNPILVALG